MCVPWLLVFCRYLYLQSSSWKVVVQDLPLAVGVKKDGYFTKKVVIRWINALSFSSGEFKGKTRFSFSVVTTA